MRLKGSVSPFKSCCLANAVLSDIRVLFGEGSGVMVFLILAIDKVEIRTVFRAETLAQRAGPWAANWPRRQPWIMVGIIGTYIIVFAGFGQLRPGFVRGAQGILHRGVGLHLIQPKFWRLQFAFTDEIAIVIDRGDALATVIGARLALHDGGQRQRVKEFIGHARAVGVSA